jgi:hypothetical protein
MNRFYNRFSILQVVGALALIYFGAHLLFGYFYCEYSDYVNCPGYLVDNKEDYEEEDEEE